MALVSIALPCPPPPEPLSPLTSAPSKHNSEGGGGRWVGGYILDITHSKDQECLFALQGSFMFSAVLAP